MIITTRPQRQHYIITAIDWRTDGQINKVITIGLKHLGLQSRNCIVYTSTYKLDQHVHVHVHADHVPLILSKILQVCLDTLFVTLSNITYLSAQYPSFTLSYFVSSRQIIYKLYCIQGKIRPRFIFALFALWFEGEFKTGLIEFCTKDYVTKLESARIQDWANQF